jgi:type I site-specific restriction endonuclease
VGYGCELLNQFESLGIAAKFVYSKSSDKERDGIIDRFAANEFQVLINVELFTEGVNCPDIECLMLLRFTYSLKVYMQMVGRLLRVGKRRKMLMDFVNNCYYHGSVEFPHQWSLEGDKTKRGSNFDSPYYRCCNNDCARTFFKKTLVQCVTAVACLKCQTETFVFPVDEPVKRNFHNLDKLIAVEKLELIDDKKVTWLSRVLFNKSQPVERRLKSVINLGLPADITRIGLEYLKIDEKRIRYYLED